jgi:hypothetical protein
MAMVNYVKTPAVPYNTFEANVVTWGPLQANDVGQPMVVPEAADRSIQFLGTFGGATVVLEGTNDTADAPPDANYSTLRDPLGTLISKTAKDAVAVTENMRLTRPHVTGGDGTTAIYAYLLLKR